MQSPVKFPSLAALAKAGSQKAQEDYLNYHRYAHIAALLLAASILFIKHPELLVALSRKTLSSPVQGIDSAGSVTRCLWAIR